MTNTKTETIDRQSIKAGDEITISRKVKVTSVRHSVSTGGLTIISFDEGGVPATAAIGKHETVERHVPQLTIPLDALIVTWLDTDNYRYFASRETSYENFTDSNVTDEWSPEKLAEEIVNPSGDFDKYKSDSFRVLSPAPKPSFASGGYVAGPPSFAHTPGYARLVGSATP